MNKRIQKARESMKRMQLDALVITSRENTKYLSDFSGSESLLIVSMDKVYFTTDFRYIESVSYMKDLGFELSLLKDGMQGKKELLKEVLSGSKKVGFEYDMPYSYFLSLTQALGNIEAVDAGRELLTLRSVKTEQELEYMQKAADIGDMAYSHILSIVKLGMSEIELAAEIEYFMKKNGASKASFDTIAISGSNTSMPHGVPSGKLLENHDAVTLDFGAVYKGYCSDMTRTFFMGEPLPEMLKIYNIVKKAQQEAQDFTKAGVSGFDVDKIARDIITSEGYGQYFGHGTGHGVGLLVHEEPRVSPKSSTILEENMVITVEPGIYVARLGGVRIENSLVVTKDGSYSLNNSNRELIII